MIGLTKVQADALRFITGFQMAKGYSPSLDEITKGLGSKHKSGTHRILLRLEERDVIGRLPDRDRAIEVLEPIAVPRGPDGEPLYFVRIGESA